MIIVLIQKCKRAVGASTATPTTSTSREDRIAWRLVKGARCYRATAAMSPGGAIGSGVGAECINRRRNSQRIGDLDFRRVSRKMTTLKFLYTAYSGVTVVPNNN
jgi:hypothetical protein